MNHPQRIAMAPEQAATPIEALGLSRRAAGGIKDSGITTFGELYDTITSRLFRAKTFGHRECAEVNNLLRRLGLSPLQDVVAAPTRNHPQGA